jgi:hypothetical protein
MGVTIDILLNRPDLSRGWVDVGAGQSGMREQPLAESALQLGKLIYLPIPASSSKTATGAGRSATSSATPSTPSSPNFFAMPFWR